MSQPQSPDDPPVPNGPTAPDGPQAEPSDAWARYLSAAQHLDSVRRTASTVVNQHTQAVQAAQQELAGVRARLAPQRSRLVHDLGVPDSELTPLPAEVAAATHAVSGGPAAALVALRQARGTADAADAAMLGSGPAAPWPAWMRNLLVYGPFAAAVLVVQIVLYLVAEPGSLPTYALLCGLSLPVLAFGLGWVTIGFVFGGADGAGKVDRTPILGAIVCMTPVILTCMGVGMIALVN